MTGKALGRDARCFFYARRYVMMLSRLSPFARSAHVPVGFFMRRPHRRYNAGMSDPSTIDRVAGGAVARWLLGIVGTLVVAGLVGLYGWLWNANPVVQSVREADLKQMQDDITALTAAVKAISEDDEHDKAQDGRLRKLESTDKRHWRIHGWSKTQINQLRHHGGQPPADWPDLMVD